MAKKNTKSRYWVDDNSILPEIVITPQGNYPVLDEAGNPARTVGAIQDINPNAHIYERMNTQPFMDDYIKGETNTAANQRADALDAQVVPHMGDFVSAATKPLDVLMPSRWVGLLDKDYNGLSVGDRLTRLFDEHNKGLYINDNPAGLFSKRFHDEHPIWAMAGNTAFDVLAGNTAINTAKKGLGTVNSSQIVNDYKTVLPKFIDTVKNFNGADKWKRTFNSGRKLLNPKYVGILAKSPEIMDITPLYKYSEFDTNLLSDFQKVWAQEAAKGPYSTEGLLKFATQHPSPSSVEELPGLFEEARKLQHTIDVASRYGRMLGNQYHSMMKELTDPVLRHIAEVSPQYLPELFRQQKYYGGATEDFVKHLIKRANSYRRFMRTPGTVEDFRTIKGSGISHRDGLAQMNVEGMLRSDFNGEYGTYPAFYEGQPNLTGDMSTWWDQRIPEGVTPSIGMHTIHSPRVVDAYKKFREMLGTNNGFLSVDGAFGRSYVETGAAPKYISWPVHQVFWGKEGTQLPNFKVTLGDEMGTLPEGFEWGKGYSYGGLLDTANKFKDGGSKNDYNTWKKKIKDYKGIIVDGDDTYDYYNFFKDNPQMAWDMLNNNPEAHFTDKYKTPNHPTFSDESMYSRPPYIQGGAWNDYSPTVMGQKWNYALSPSQINSNWDVERTINYLANAENEGAYVTDNNGRYPIIDGTVLGGTLTPVTITPNNHSQGGSLKSASWNDLSMREKADIIKVGVKHGLNRLDDIKSKYNEFAEGGNIYSGKGPHSQQMNQQVKQRYIYDILPQLYAMDGVNVRVSSGLRPNAVVYKNGKPTNRKSRHGMGQAVDIVPGEGATFNDIFRVLNNPNSNVSKWMRANGVGYIDETSATGTTKYWHDHKKDHSHVHHQIGGSPATQYATRFNAQQRPVNKAWERRAEAYWEKAQAMYKELLDAGVNPVAAAGILGNIAQESEFNPNAANSINGGHWGYLQNDKNITPWVRANYGGYDHRSQMNYLIAGLQGKLPKSNMGLDRRFNGFNARMQGVTDPEMAAYLWEREYEKSANEGVPQRRYFARYFYDRMMGNNGMAQQQYNPLMFNMEDPSQYNANAGMPENVDPELYYKELDRKKWEDNSYSSLLSSDANQDSTVVDRVQASPESQASSFLKWIVPILSSQSSSNTGNVLLNTINMLNYGTKSPDIYSSFNPFNLTI